jgi:MFS family permease
VVVSLRELAPIIGLYALYMRDSGLSPGQFATALVLWSVTGFVLEVPSGALADRMDRRRLLVISAGAYVGAFVAWAVWPSYPGFVLGFVLWGASTALDSGTFEALLHDELTARGVPGAYGPVRARSRAAATVALALGIAASGPLFGVGGYRLVGLVSIVVAAAHLASVWLLPTAPQAEDVAEEGSYLDTLRTGVGEALGRPVLRRILAAYMAVILVIGVDEYVANLWSESGVRTGVLTTWLAVMVAAEALGTLGSHRLAHSGGRVVGVVVPSVGALLVSAGAWAGSWVVLVAVVVGYGLLATWFVALDIRLQDAISGKARATVTSVAGLSNEVASITSFAAFGALAGATTWRESVWVLAAAFAVPVALTAWRSPVPSTRGR